MTREADRVLPHNLQAERAVLGAVLLNNTLLDQAIDTIAPEHFYRDAHRRLFAAFLALDEHQRVIDLVTVNEELARLGELDEIGGPAYVAALVDGLPRSANIKHYVDIVREKKLLRELIAASNKTLGDAYDGEQSAAEILTASEGRLLEVQMQTERRDVVDLRLRADRLSTDLEARVAHRGQLSGVETGFKLINDLTFGWQRGDLIIIAARPSMGKTTFVLNSAVAGAKAGAHVVVFSFEMKREQLEYRILSSLSGVALSKIQGGYLLDADYPAISQALCVLHELPIYIQDRRGLTITDVRAMCRRLRLEHPLHLVVIDYVQLIRGSLQRRGATRNEELGDISERTKWLADELGVPIIVLSQLKRIAGARPQLDDLRDSGSLEQDADIVAFLHRKNHKESGITNFILEKARNGPTGTVNLSLDRDITTFTDAGEETPEQAKAVDEEEAKARKTRAIIRQQHRAHAR